MTQSTAAAEGIADLDLLVEGDRVDCPRIGPVTVDRCLECSYFVRLEYSHGRWQAPARVVCAVSERGDEIGFAW